MDATFWAHAAVSAVLILLTLWALRAFGVTNEQGKWSWPTFAAVLVVMFVLNLVWPWPT